MSETIGVLTHRLRNCQEYVARVLKSDIFVVFPGDRNWNSAWSGEVSLSGPVNGGGRVSLLPSPGRCAQGRLEVIQRKRVSESRFAGTCVFGKYVVEHRFQVD